MSRRKQPSRQVPEIELDTLLHGNPTWPQVVEFFQKGEFHQEHYLVAAIKRHLRTDAQRRDLANADISIEDMLNGRVGGQVEQLVDRIFAEWNAKLGFKHFGF